MRRGMLSLGVVACLGMAWYTGYQMALNARPLPLPAADTLVDVSAETPAIPIAANQPNDLPPLKVREVVDLARAYEPVPVKEPVAPEVLNPVTFVELPPRDKMPPGQIFAEPVGIAPREVN